MNKCFKVIFNHARNCFMVVSESSSSVHRTSGKTAAILSLALLVCVNSGIVNAAEYVVVGGEGPGVALGAGSLAGDKFAIAIGSHAGYKAEATGDGSIAIGMNAKSTESRSLAVGRDSQATGQFASAFGNNAFATADNAQAMGRGSRASATGSMALGSGAVANVADSVAIGAGSIANRQIGVANAYLKTSEDSGSVWVSSHGAFSVGSSTVTRQITGVAAGSESTDAVNVAQLRALKSYSDATFSTASNTIFGEGTSNVITPDVTGEDGNVTEEAIRAQNAVIMGNNGTVKTHNGSAFGYNAQVMEDAPEGSVAIGAGSVASMAGRTATSPYVAGDTTVDTSKGGAWASEGLVSFGYTETTGEGEGATSVTRNRTLTGVAAGSEDNDAVNVAQLKQLESNTATQLSNLMTGETKVSTIQLTADPNDVNAPTIGLRYEAAKAEPVALEDGDQGMEISQGRLVYNNLDAAGQPVGDPITVATLNDGITISAGSSSSAARDGTESVKVDLNKGISFLTDSEYLSTNVAADGNGGAVVTFNTTQALKDALANAGGNTGGNTGGDSGNTGDTGGSGWNPSQAQLAAMNGNFANGITVAPGEGNQAIQIKQGTVDMGGNRIQNVGNPINDGDAANKAYVDSTSRSLRNKINDVDKDLRAGVAMAMAVGGLPQAYMPGKSIFGVSAGTYHGQGGFALGLSHATDNRQWVFKGAASVDTRGNFGGQLSAGYQF